MTVGKKFHIFVTMVSSPQFQYSMVPSLFMTAGCATGRPVYLNALTLGGGAADGFVGSLSRFMRRTGLDDGMCLRYTRYTTRATKIITNSVAVVGTHSCHLSL
jgi:hypothetical protein